MQTALKSIDVSTDYENAGYRLQLISNGKMFDDNIGIKLILIPDNRLTTCEHLVESRLSPREAAQLGNALIAAASQCQQQFSKPRKDKRR